MKLDQHWRQVSGDMNPGRYGCVLARTTDDGLTIDLLEVQPVRGCAGLREALEVGFPFWSRAATYWISDLRADERFRNAYRFCDADPTTACNIELVCALLEYGVNVEESNAGWARDVFPPKAHYWCNKRPVSGAYFADADAEFRRALKGAL